MRHLWEYDHPYYCGEGNYLHSPARDGDLIAHEQLESWESFKESGWYDNDHDLNLLFRWDWHAGHLEFPEDFTDGSTEHTLQLYFILQRKAFNRSIYVTVTEDDEPEIRTWLAERALTIGAIWEPVIAS